MTPRDYLNRPNRIRREIGRKQARIENLRRLSVNVSPLLQKDRVRATPDPTRVQKLLAEIVDGEREIVRLREALARAMIETALYISVLPKQSLCRILEDRYVYGCDWDETADRNLCSADWAYRQQQQALALLPPPPEETEEDFP
jgi:hypothetical protein